MIPAGLTLPRTKRAILDAVRARPGISAEDLRAIVWTADPNGGPEDRKVLHVHVHQLNKLLASLGVAVRGSVSGGYRVIAALRREDRPTSDPLPGAPPNAYRRIIAALFPGT